MPRYKLRTLLIVLALGPPLLAGPWLLGPAAEEAVVAVIALVVSLALAVALPLVFVLAASSTIARLERLFGYLRRTSRRDESRRSGFRPGDTGFTESRATKSRVART